MKEYIIYLSSISYMILNKCVIQIMLELLQKSYNLFVQAILCQDEVKKFKKLCKKLLLEGQRQEVD